MHICRECENEINQATEICPQCGADLTGPAPGADAPAAQPNLKKILIRWGILLTVLLGAIWSFLWFVVPERQGNPTAQAETRAVQSLRDVHALLAEYASSQGGSYPRQLEVLGERARNAAQLAQSVNYRIQYTPGPVEADGNIRTYSLLAHAGNFGFLNFFTDENAVVRATRENRPATATDPPY